MRCICLVSVFSVVFLTGVCGAQSVQDQDDSFGGISRIDERDSSVGASSSLLDQYREQGRQRLIEQNAATDSTELYRNSMLNRLDEMMEEQREREYENRTDPFRIYQSHSTELMKKRKERHDKELELQRLKDKAEQREEASEEEAVDDFAVSEYLAQNAASDTHSDVASKSSDKSVIEEQTYTLYSARNGVPVEQVKLMVKQGKIKASDLIPRQWSWLLEAP